MGIGRQRLENPSKSMGKLITAAMVLIAVAAYRLVPARIAIPEHLLGHGAVAMGGLIPPRTGAALLSHIKDMREFPSNARGVGRPPVNEHIGEAVPTGADGRCKHPFLVPDTNRTQCVLPGRVDVGRHYIMAGGVEGHKESYDTLIARTSSFSRYIFNLSQYPEVKDLFRTDKFQGVAKRVCPADKQVLDPFQFNFIIQVPGQTVPLHIDAPWFWGATRFQYPQWLLAVMVFSNLFKDRFVKLAKIDQF